jgi:2-keto-4-pentenoate hydratase/2-oxohepta-3-ene-1,7-dioic acid hydratase in catechol pathway
MKLLRLERMDGSIGWGVEQGAACYDLSGFDPQLEMPTSHCIEKWDSIRPYVESLLPGLTPVAYRKLLCPISDPQKVLCIGLNYRKHAIETGMAIPGEPIVFSKMPSAVIGPDIPIVIPSIANRVDYEAELVIIIGRTTRHASPEDAAQAIFGYTIGNDVSARDWQLEKPGKQWFLGKTFDSFAPIGPSITLASHLPDSRSDEFGRMGIRLRLNGEEMQSSTLSDLIFGPVEIVQYLSRIMTLHPGDMIFTGTPSGVGMARTPPRYLADGDRVEISIDLLGTLCNPCRAESL